MDEKMKEAIQAAFCHSTPPYGPIGNHLHTDWQAFLAFLRASGYAVVPREATPAMARAGWEEAPLLWDEPEEGALSQFSDIWRTMLAASE
jgi:hypothetical protein